jgi:hypothetical protein
MPMHVFGWIHKHPSTTAARLVEVQHGAATPFSFTDLSRRKSDRRQDPRVDMRDDETIRVRLEQLRGQFLQWGTPDLRVFVVTKDELRGWIWALEWVLGRGSGDITTSSSAYPA